MIFHQNIIPLTEITSKLIFTNKNIMTMNAINDGSSVDVKTTLVCNELDLNEFKESINKVVSGIIKSIKTLVDKKGKESYNEIIETIISLDKYKDSLYKGDEYIGYNKYINTTIENSEAYKFGAIDIVEYESSIYSENDYFIFIFSTIRDLKNSLIELSKSSLAVSSKVEKLTWNTKPSILAELLRELELKDWIVPPKYNSDTSYRGLAKICANIFTFEGTERSLTNALQSPTIDVIKSESIKLPHLKDLA